MYYSVVNYEGGMVTAKQDAEDYSDALSLANETPHSSVQTMDDNGWVLKLDIYSPKHPVSL